MGEVDFVEKTSHVLFGYLLFRHQCGTFVRFTFFSSGPDNKVTPPAARFKREGCYVIYVNLRYGIPALKKYALFVEMDSKRERAHTGKEDAIHEEYRDGQ